MKIDDMRALVNSLSAIQVADLQAAIDDRRRDLAGSLAPDDCDEKEREMLTRGDIMGAVKAVRMRLGLPLRDAKAFVDRFRSRTPRVRYEVAVRCQESTMPDPITLSLARLTIEQASDRPARTSARKDRVTFSILASNDEMPMLGDLVWEALTDAGFEVVDPTAVPVDEGLSLRFTVKIGEGHG